MPITPVEIRHLTFKRGFGGYRRSQIDRALAEIAESFEQVWRQRADLADRIEELEQEVKRHVELEALLRSTLVSAERAAHDLKSAQKAADRAEDDAVFAIDYAYAAVDEAEYAVLDAMLTRMDADALANP